jgi:hypothetical protein
MRFGIFYEHQLPRPWGPRSEHTLLSNALEQIELADRSGLDHVWEVEHHLGLANRMAEMFGGRSAY